MKKILALTSLATIIGGLILVSGGSWGLVFTYNNVARENITTPADAATPNVPVRGPITLKAQSDIIRIHTLGLTNGKTFAEMPRQIPQLDQNGQPLLGTDGKPMMTANAARDIWVTATALITALNLGILAYAFFGINLLLGLILIGNGIATYALSRKFYLPLPKMDK